MSPTDAGEPPEDRAGVGSGRCGCEPSAVDDMRSGCVNDPGNGKGRKRERSERKGRPDQRDESAHDRGEHADTD